MTIVFHEIIDCTGCDKMMKESEAIYMESQIDKEIYPYCSEECFLSHEADRMGTMIDDAMLRAEDARLGL